MEQEQLARLRETVQHFIRLFGLLESNRTPCGTEFSVSQVFALQELERQAMSVTELANKLDLERSTVSRLVETLVAPGFLSRLPNPANRREVILRLTPKGENMLNTVKQTSFSYYRAILEQIPAEDRQTVFDGMEKWTEALVKYKEKNKK